MIFYDISYQYPNRQLIDFHMTFTPDKATTYLQLPAWRPGRYELGNFAKNILKLSVLDAEHTSIPTEKVSKDRWKLNTLNVREVHVHYQVYAAEMSGGGTWLDENQVYINFVNCTLYPEDRIDDTFRVHLELPDNYQIACGLQKVEPRTLEAPSFYHLVESPLIASASLTHWTYTLEGSTFHLWFQGEIHLDEKTVIHDFKTFTKEQIRTMGDFPCDDYHFLFQFLPYRAYHGVEHFNSTIIILGPSEELQHHSKLYHDFIGVSSHELFHTWNIIRIRPAEMMPYDYTKENYFVTGYVAEGVTTYYGDLYLARSGVITKQAYFEDLNKIFKRHFENFGRFNHSLAESSYDLWLDGYVSGVPNRKVSIYIKGAIVSLMLDLSLRHMTGNRSSLDEVMRRLWEAYAKKKKGYSPQDIINITSELAGEDMQLFFDQYIYGTTPVEKALNTLLQTVGCQLSVSDSASRSESFFGFQTVEREGKILVSKIEPGSPAELALCRQDEIIAVDGIKIGASVDEMMGEDEEVAFTIARRQQITVVYLLQDEKRYFKQYTISQRADAEEQERDNFSYWCGLEW
jgi:predicted metalloprotease with PDZ domain